MMTTISREFTFEAAHALEGYDGACREIHGHSYRLVVSIEGEPCSDENSPKYGMVMDFRFLKSLVAERILSLYDHSFIVRKTERNARLREVLRSEFSNIREVEFQPTCENLVYHFAELLRDELPDGVHLAGLKLYETATSYAQWHC